MSENNEFKIYEIKTIADFDQVPSDRIDECLEDFKSFLVLRNATLGMIREIGIQMKEEGDLDEDVDTNNLFQCDTFKWVDDGLKKATITLNANTEI
jgi:hypothetical protein